MKFPAGNLFQATIVAGILTIPGGPRLRVDSIIEARITDQLGDAGKLTFKRPSTKVAN